MVSGAVGDEHRPAVDPSSQDPSSQEVDGVLGHHVCPRLRQLGAVEAGLAMHMRRGAKRAAQRRVRSRRDRDVGPAPDLERDERVPGRLVQRLVAGDGRDADQLDFRRGEREEDRNRVVVAGIAVDDDPRAHRRASTSSAVGSEV